MNTAAVWAIFVGGILGAIGAFLSLFGDSAAMGLLVLLASPLVGLGVFGALVTRMRKRLLRRRSFRSSIAKVRVQLLCR